MRFRCSEFKSLFFQFFKFGTIGLGGFAIDCIFLQIGLDVLHLGPYFSAVFSFPFAVTFTWIGNRLYTFRGQNQGSIHAQWARFFMVCAIGIVLNRGTYALLVYEISLVHHYPVLGLFGGTIAGMFFNFFSSRRFVFRA